MSQEPDLVAVKLVALDGYQMPLVKADRIEAIKIMAENNLSRVVMAHRLCMNVDALERYAQNHKIPLPPNREPSHWSKGYMDRTARDRKARYTKRQLENKDT